MAKVIRLTESDLHHLIKEAIDGIQENMGDDDNQQIVDILANVLENDIENGVYDEQDAYEALSNETLVMSSIEDYNIADLLSVTPEELPAIFETANEAHIQFQIDSQYIPEEPSTWDYQGSSAYNSLENCIIDQITIIGEDGKLIISSQDVDFSKLEDIISSFIEDSNVLVDNMMEREDYDDYDDDF